MFVTELYINKIRQALDTHQEVHCVPHMRELVDSAITKKMTTVELNEALTGALENREKTWPRIKHAFIKASRARAQARKSALLNALQQAMSEVTLTRSISGNSSPRSPRTLDAIPPTPDTFTRDLYLHQLSLPYSPSEIGATIKINNSIERLRKMYEKHQKALQNLKLDPATRSYHQARVDMILHWMNDSNFSMLTSLIESMNEETRKDKFSVTYNKDDSFEIIAHKRNILHWHGIILENPAACENPYAMSDILRILELKNEKFETEVQLFAEIYILEAADTIKINIDAKLKDKFKQQLENDEFENLRSTLEEIYEKLHQLLMFGNNIPNELQKLESELDLDHPSNRSRQTSMTGSSKETILSSDSMSSKDALSSSSSSLFTLSRRSTRIKSGSSSPDLTAAKLAENNGSSKSTLNQ